MKQEYSKNKKDTKNKQTHWLKKYIVFALVLVLATSCVCLTFAWYIDTVARRGTVSFGEIDISNETAQTFEENTLIENVVPNMQIANAVTFQKAATSRDFYVRVKMKYELETAITAEGLLTWMASINRTPLACYNSDEAYCWTALQDDGYYYLVEQDDNTSMYKVDHENTIYLTDGFKFPAGNVQLLDSTGKPIQKGLDINLKIIIEAIQADIPTIVAGTEQPKLVNIVRYFDEGIRDFTYVDYLVSDGAQYIDTGLELCRGISSEVKFYTDSTNQFIYGARDDTVTYGYSFLFGETATTVSYHTANVRGTEIITYNPLGAINTLIQSESGVKFVDARGAEHLVKLYTPTLNYNTKRTIYLLYVNGNPIGTGFKGKIYSAKFYVDGMLVLNLRPAVEKTTNKPMLYDCVSGNHYYNIGTGSDFSIP